MVCAIFLCFSTISAFCLPTYLELNYNLIFLLLMNRQRRLLTINLLGSANLDRKLPLLSHKITIASIRIYLRTDTPFSSFISLVVPALYFIDRNDLSLDKMSLTPTFLILFALICLFFLSTIYFMLLLSTMYFMLLLPTM
jgi:hypothetical protein